jgi:CheY-like chemotaxis protein
MGPYQKNSASQGGHETKNKARDRPIDRFRRNIHVRAQRQCKWKKRQLRHPCREAVKTDRIFKRVPGLVPAPGSDGIFIRALRERVDESHGAADICEARETVVKCILIVDDNAVMRHMLRTEFEDIAGWAVCGEAENGRDAIDKARVLRRDLIVLPTAPIILFTLYVNKFFEQQAFFAGVTAVISKETGVKALVNQAQDLLKAA